MIRFRHSGNRGSLRPVNYHLLQAVTSLSRWATFLRGKDCEGRLPRPKLRKPDGNLYCSVTVCLCPHDFQTLTIFTSTCTKKFNLAATSVVCRTLVCVCISFAALHCLQLAHGPAFKQSLVEDDERPWQPGVQAQLSWTCAQTCIFMQLH